MKRLIPLAFLSILLSCSFGEKQKIRDEEPIAVPMQFVNYEIELIDKKYGPCQTDPLANRCVTFRIEYPKISTEAGGSIPAKINENIQSSIFEYAFINDKPENFNSLIEEISEEYEGIIKEFPDYENAWSLEVTSDIIFQDSLFISLATTIYSYTGGAHPNAYQVYKSYSLETGEPLSLNDLLVVDYEEALNSAGEIEFRMQKKIPPTESLEDKGYVFQNGRFGLNDNFAIINRSLLFYFNSYEIAPYALGPTELELKLTDYISLINENGVLKNLKN